MRKKGRKSPKVTVAYDPRFTDYVYLPFNDGKEVITCPLTPAAKTFRGRDWLETQDHFARETVSEDLSRNRRIRGKAKTHAIQKQMIEEATKKTDQARHLVGKQSKSTQTKNISNNRAKEKLAERQLGAWNPGAKKSDQDELPIKDDFSVSQNSPDIYIPPLSHIDNIRQIRNRLKGDKND